MFKLAEHCFAALLVLFAAQTALGRQSVIRKAAGLNK